MRQNIFNVNCFYESFQAVGPLVEIYKGYLQAGQRACVAALENLHNKYSVTAKVIEVRRNANATKLKAFLVELGYE
jgi:type I restriction enzyme M protein